MQIGGSRDVHQIDLALASKYCATNAYIPILASASQPLSSAKRTTHLWLNQHQIDEQDHKIMLDIFVAELPAIFADGQAHPMAAGLVIGARVFGIEGLDWIATFYADGHCMRIWGMLSSMIGGRDHIVM
jgi:hypothetical protein